MKSCASQLPQAVALTFMGTRTEKWPKERLASMAVFFSRVGFKGRPVVINFFASWCVPCREEHPLLMRLAEKEHIPLYGIDYKDRPEDARKLLAQFGNPFKSVGLDSDGRAGLDFGVYGVPETYVLDGTGHIRKKFTGPMTAKQVEQELLPILKQLGGGV